MSDRSVDSDSALAGAITSHRASPEGLPQLDIVGDIVASALDWHASPDVSSLLREIVVSAVRVLPGCDGAALVTVDSSDGLVARAAIGPAHALIESESALGEGPNWQVAGESEPIAVDLSVATRWQQFAAQAITSGIASLSCHPLVVGKEQWGSLLLLSRTPNALAHLEISMSMFAAQAAIAVNTFERWANVQARASARASIEQAKGIVMARRSVCAELAFDFLRRQSQDQNIKLRIVSENVCRSVLDSNAGNCLHSGR